MNYFKHIDLDWVPFRNRVIKLIEDYPKLIEKGPGAFVALKKEQVIEIYPELARMIKPLGLTILYVALYTIYDNKGTLHSDGTHVPIRITLPILNCENSITTFYQVTEEGTAGLQQNGLGATYYDPKKSTPVASYELTGPVILRVTEPHQVVSTNDVFPRISCSIAFKEDIEYLLEN